MKIGIKLIGSANYCWPRNDFCRMADDLADFIESQKRKLEKERAEILAAQESEVRMCTCNLIVVYRKL